MKIALLVRATPSFFSFSLAFMAFGVAFLPLT
jgi:hypothetical protein